MADLSRDNYLAGDYAIGSFISREFTGELNLGSGEFEREQDLSELAGNFTASEEIFAGYAMVEQRFADKFLIVAGVRLEQTQLEYEGFQFDDEEETLTGTPQENRDYLNVLPGLHLIYNILPRTVLRFAYTNTLALMAEHYFGTVGILSGGLFYKDVNDFIVTQRFEGFNFEGREWENFAQPINGGNATLFGAEIAFQRQLDFIAPSLKGVGLYFNYTFTSSEVTDFNFEGREDDELEIPGSPKHTLNASIAYEDKRFTSRLSFNYASDFVDEVGESDFFDRHYDQVTKTLGLYANANNLLNQPLRYFQSVSRRTMQAEYYNVRFDVGVKFDMSN